MLGQRVDLTAVALAEVLSNSMKKARADFHVFLDRRQKNVDDCPKVRPV
jgi:hypothetical protein